MAKAADESPVRADPESRVGRFMRSALSILAETGRTDFTVLEVVERSKTSLRSFYQHFSTKDELLLALIDTIMSESTKTWRTETESLPAAEAMHVLIERICTPAETTKQDSINRGLTYYNDHLAESLPQEYARVLSARTCSGPTSRSRRRPHSSCRRSWARCGCAVSALSSTACRSPASTSMTSASAACFRRPAPSRSRW